jgi:RHS repeat-associated protein
LAEDKVAVGGNSLITRYHYNDKNQPIGMTYPSGRRIDFGLTSLGQVSQLSMTVDGQVQMLADNINYLPFGPMTDVDYGNGLTLNRQFDLDFRLTGQSTDSVENKQFTFTARNNLETITDIINSKDNQNFAYSPLQSLIEADGDYGQLDFSYDAISNRLSRANDGQIDNYSYAPSSHHLQSISGSTTSNFIYNAAGETIAKDNISFSYNTAGRMVSANNDGVITRYQYNYLGQRTTKIAAGVTTYYLYDLAGRLISEINAAGTSVVEYIYLNDQLLSVIYNPDTTTPVPEDLAFDDADSMVSKVGQWSQSKSRKSYNGYHQIANGGSNSAISWPPDIIGGSYQVYARWVSNRKYAQQAVYAIDHDGITDTVLANQTANGSQWNLLGTFAFNGQGNETITLNDCNGKVSADAIRLVRVADLPQPAGALLYVHNNHLGAPTKLSDDSGEVVWSAYYSPFGLGTIDDDVDGDNQPVTFNPRFPGQYFDVESGLHYNYYRYYDPATGRYMRSDPIGLEAGINTFGYVGGNPVNYYDPNGQAAVGAVGVCFLWPVGTAGCAVVAVGSALVLSQRIEGMQEAFKSNINQNEASDCNDDSDDECKKLNQKVGSAKKEVGMLGKCRAGMSKYELRIRKAAWLRLAQARSQREQKCWNGGDLGHQTQLADVWKNVGTCSGLMQ